MISTSEIKTSVVIDEKYMELAVRSHCTKHLILTSQQLNQLPGVDAIISPDKFRKRDRVAEGAPLLREYGVLSPIEGSNPSVSAKYLVFMRVSSRFLN